MKIESREFIRGVALSNGADLDNPLTIRNPRNDVDHNTNLGVYFYACDTENHTRDARNWAVQNSTLTEGLDPYLIRFKLSRDQFPLLRARLYTLRYIDGSYQWLQVPSFDAIGCEVQLNGFGMQRPDIEKLGVILERVEL